MPGWAQNQEAVPLNGLAKSLFTIFGYFAFYKNYLISENKKHKRIPDKLWTLKHVL